jgi:cell division protein FtsL
VRRTVWLLLAAVTAVGILILFVFPTRTLLEQNREIASTQSEITALDHENAVLRARAAALEDPAQVARIARQQYGLVMPGQKAYAIVAAPGPQVAPPKKGEAAHRSHHRGLLQDLEFWN